jgi:hypothetical protein
MVQWEDVDGRVRNYPSVSTKKNAQNSQDSCFHGSPNTYETVAITTAP